MREDLLHFIWKYKKIPLDELCTSGEEVITISSVGIHNQLSGPDFFNASIKIDNQLWAGNVEIHIKSSDWYAHHHEQDPNYDNVILHVVWDDDSAVFRKDGSQIPTLELKRYVSKELLHTYQNLFDEKQYTFVNCENSIADVDDFIIKNWADRLYLERLERKSVFTFELLKKSNNDWEQVLFAMLLKNFGLKINGQSFLSISNALNFSIIRRLHLNVEQLESVFYGVAHMLESDAVLDTYYLNLKKEYAFLKHKYDLNSMGVLKPEFFKLRPPNFPTIRLSQLSNLYHTHHNLFDKIINANSLEDLYSLFNVAASPYWNTHFTFGKTSRKSTKKATNNFIDLLIINTILPIKFCYQQYLGKDDNEAILQIISKIKGERNSIITSFNTHGLNVKNAQESQSFIQMYNEYCVKNKCLECAIGNQLLKGID